MHWKKHHVTVPNCLFVLDGYHFDKAYQSLLRSAACRLMVIDDTAHLPRYDADIILNQGLDAQRLTYKLCPVLRMFVLSGTAGLNWGSWLAREM